MVPLSNGAAFLDGSGELLAADDGFLKELGLPREGLEAAWRSRAGGLVDLRDGAPPRVRLDGPHGAVELDRLRTAGGTLLLARGGEAAACLEHALRSEAFGPVAAGVAHDVKNPLNAMALQLALLGEKLADAGVAGAHLASLREQVGRVNEVMRRFLDVVDPAGAFGVDLQALAADAASLLGHEARRRHVTLVLEPAPAAVRTSADAARAGRLVLGLLSAALAETPERARLGVRVVREVERVALVLERGGGPPGPALAALAATEAPGTLELSHADGAARMVLRLPGEVLP